MILRKKSFLSNPSMIFSIVWTIVLILHSLKWSNLILDTNLEVLIIIAITIITGFILSFLSLKKTKRKFHLKTRLNKKISKLFKLWLIISTIEFIFEGNFPLLGVLGFGRYIAYTDYGISGLHGLANSIQLVLITHYAFKVIIKKSNKYDKIKIFALLSFSILLLSRAIFLMQIAAIGIMLFSFNKLKIKNLLYIIVIGIIVVFAVNELGKAKTEGGDYDISIIAELNDNYPKFLPDGFIWVYLYVSTPVNNIYYAFPRMKPNYFPLNNIIDFLPNMIKNKLKIIDNNPIILPNDNLNVSSYLESFFKDFGIFLFIPIIIFQIIFSKNWEKSKESHKHLYTNVIFGLMALFSFFVNTFAMFILYSSLMIIEITFKEIKLGRYGIHSNK